MPAKENAPSPSVRRMDTFRQRQTRRPLHPAERQLLWLLGAHLVFLPWALGTMHPWSQGVSLGFGVLGLGLALRPRIYDGDLCGAEPPFRSRPGAKLARWPIFWIGLGLLFYVFVQALNPSWRYVLTPQLWWLTREKNIAWLPTSIAAPFGRSNAWRQLVIYATGWLTVCTVWVGLTRRRSFRILLIVLVANGLALAGILAAQHVLEDTRIPWPLTALTPSSLTASFIYENHAGAYFALVTFAAVALATWYSDHGARTLKKSNPAAACGLAAAILGGAVFFTLSRGAALTLTLAVLVYATWFLLRRRGQTGVPGTNPLVARVLAGGFVAFALVAFHYLDFSEIYARFEALAVERSHDPNVNSRLLARAAATDLLRAQGWRGVGAGGFRHLFPEYVKHYPSIYNGGQLYWEHAHDDWLEIPIELGLAGCLFLAAGAGWWMQWFVRRKVGWHPLALPLLIGCSQTLAHAWFDFPFQCPAILVTWCVLLALAGRAVQMKT
jgi:O-Antigen ligase